MVVIVPGGRHLHRRGDLCLRSQASRLTALQGFGAEDGALIDGFPLAACAQGQDHSLVVVLRSCGVRSGQHEAQVVAGTACEKVGEIRHLG